MISAGMKTTKGDWTISNPPPTGDDDVGPFFYNLYLLGEADKDRLGLPERWRYNHRMFRGDHWNTNNIGGRVSGNKIAMNLIFANIQRTVANLTAKQPVVEAVEVGNERGDSNESDQDLTAWLKKWWSDTDQGDLLVDSANQMELYGPTIEKAVMQEGRPGTVVIDPFAFGKAPGVFDDVQDCPFLYHIDVMRCDEIEQSYGLEPGTVEADDVYSTVGEDREDNAPVPAGTATMDTAIDRVNMSTVGGRHLSVRDKNRLESRALVTELWFRDMGGDYDDNIRVVTLTNHGNLVLDDTPNPNVNWARYKERPELVDTSYLFGRFPFRVAASYRDRTTNWGFSALEQTADLNQVLDEIISRLYDHINKAMMPVLIVPKDTGVKPIHINNRPGLILRPASSAHAAAIRYMEPPRVSVDIYQFISLIRSFFDQVWHIEDADRGQAPSGVIAAQAIQALQERNAVLMRAKIRSVDSLVSHRGRCAISMLQNFGLEPEFVMVNDEIREVIGTALAGRYYDFVVESGSTVHKTTMQTQEQAVKLFEMGVIDRQALLESLNFPNWKAIIERVGETQLDQALQILVDAGMLEEEAMQLKQILMIPQEPANIPEEAEALA